MKNPKKTLLSLFLSFLLLFGALEANVHVDELHSHSYSSTFPNPEVYYSTGWLQSSGQVSVPAGAEVNWELVVATSGSGSGTASANATGALLIADTITSGSLHDYVFLSSSGTVYYTIVADTYTPYGTNGQAEAHSIFVVAWQ